MGASLGDLRRALDAIVDIALRTGMPVHLSEFADGSAIAEIGEEPEPVVVAVLGARGVWTAPSADIRRGPGWAIVSVRDRFTWIWATDRAHPAELTAHAMELDDRVLVAGGSPDPSRVRELLSAVGVRVLASTGAGAAIAAAELAACDGPAAVFLDRTGMARTPVVRSPTALRAFGVCFAVPPASR